MADPGPRPRTAGGDGRQASRPVEPFAGQQADAVVLLDGDQPIAVELDLVEPRPLLRRRLDQGGELRTQLLRQRRAHGGRDRGTFGRLRVRRGRPGFPLRLRLRRRAGLLQRHFLLQRHRLLQHSGVDAARFPLVVLLDQQPVLRPVLRPRLEPDQHELAVQPGAVQDELQLPLVERRRGFGALRFPRPAIPGLDGAGAVVAFGDDAGKIGVVQRVVLGAHGEALVGGVERRPPRHGPAPQDAAVLKPEIPVQPGRVVLLDHEDRLAVASLPVARGGFGRRRKIAAGPIGSDRRIPGGRRGARHAGSTRPCLIGSPGRFAGPVRQAGTVSGGFAATGRPR